VWESVIILDFMRHGEDNRGKCTDNVADDTPSGRLMSPPPSSPNFMLDALLATTLAIYPQAWDKHQICWIAYLEAWKYHVSNKCEMPKMHYTVCKKPTNGKQ